MCTSVRFVDNNGNMFLGRNLDWGYSYGERIVFTPVGYTWKPEYVSVDGTHAVIGVGIIAEDKPLYFDCGNDAGLAVAGLNFPGYAEYEEEPVDGKLNIAAYEFPFWVARSFATLDEVRHALRSVAIVAKSVNDEYPVSMLHWIIGDKTGSIVVEYTSTGMHVYENDVDALTNQPEYPFHRTNLTNYMNSAPEMLDAVKWGNATLTPWGAGLSAHGLPGDPNSTSRFIRAAYTNTHYPVQETEKDNVTRLFRTLSASSMIKGQSIMPNGNPEYTVFTDGFSANTLTYYKADYDDPTIRAYPMSGFDAKLSTLQTM